MAKKIPAAKGDDKRARQIDPKQGAREYAKDKASGGDFYCRPLKRRRGPALEPPDHATEREIA